MTKGSFDGVYIVGCGQTAYEKKTTKTSPRLIWEAAHLALDSAGLKWGAVDGLGVTCFTLAPESDQKRHLRFSTLRFLPLTSAQAARIDAALAAGNDVTHWLSPRQRLLAAQIAVLLAREPRALEGFMRPDRPEALADYQRRLTLRLAQSPRS